MNRIEELLQRIFSEKCQLQYLRLDISNEYQCGPLHKCLSRNSSLSSDSILTHPRSCCLNLRYVDIRLNSTSFLLNLIEHVPNLEQLSVEFIFSLVFDFSSKWNVEASRKNNENWFNQVRKKILLNLSFFHSVAVSNSFSF